MVNTDLSNSPIGNASRPNTPGFQQFQQLKHTQEQVLQQHQQFAKGLQDKQAQVQLRQSDLNIAGRLLKILDPTLPKPARMFLMNELAKNIGIDPKSESFKGVAGMISALDPDSLMALRSMFSQQTQDAEPGKVVDMARGIMSGQVPMDDIIGELQGMSVEGAQGEDQLAGGSGGDAVAKPGPAGAGSVRSFEGQRTIPDDAKMASPQLVKALGLDPRQTFRNGDLIQQGFSIPLDSKDQEKLAREINDTATNLSSTIRESSRIVKLFEGRPEILGPVGSFVRGMQSTVSQAIGIMRLANPGLEVDQDASPYAPNLRSTAKEVGSVLAKAHGYIIKNAEDSARIEAAVLGLAYRMAAAQNIPGNRLTNGILDQQLRQIGQSASPDQFKAVIRDTLDGTIRTFDEGIKRQLGVSGNDLMVRQLTPQDLEEFAMSKDILPQQLIQSMSNDISRRRDAIINPQAAGTPKPSSPTIQEEQQTLGELETQKKQRELEKFEQEGQLARNRDERAAAAEQRAEGREERMTAAQEKSQKLAEDRFTYDKQMTDRRDERAEEAAQRAESREERMIRQNEASMGLQREKFEYDKTKDARDLEQRKSEKLAEAFRAFGHAIANSMSGAGGSVGSSGGGSGQDVGAFRITPMPQRQAPSIPRGGNGS